MKNKYLKQGEIRVFIFFLSIVSFLCICNKKPTENLENKELPFVAVWSCKISPLFGLTDTLTISLNIKEDYRYALLLREYPNDTLFMSTGKWMQKNDSLILTGSECKYLDTLPSPDTLAKLPDSVCNKSISLLLPLSEEKVWNIPTADLSVVLYSFPVSKEIIDMIPSLIPLIPLTKEE